MPTDNVSELIANVKKVLHRRASEGRGSIIEDHLQIAECLSALHAASLALAARVEALEDAQVRATYPDPPAASALGHVPLADAVERWINSGGFTECDESECFADVYTLAAEYMKIRPEPPQEVHEQAEPTIHYAPYGKRESGTYACGSKEGGYTTEPSRTTCEGCKREHPGLWPQPSPATPAEPTGHENGGWMNSDQQDATRPHECFGFDKDSTHCGQCSWPLKPGFRILNRGVLHEQSSGFTDKEISQLNSIPADAGEHWARGEKWDGEKWMTAPQSLHVESGELGYWNVRDGKDFVAAFKRKVDADRYVGYVVLDKPACELVALCERWEEERRQIANDDSFCERTLWKCAAELRAALAKASQ